MVLLMSARVVKLACFYVAIFIAVIFTAMVIYYKFDGEFDEILRRNVHLIKQRDLLRPNLRGVDDKQKSYNLVAEYGDVDKEITKLYKATINLQMNDDKWLMVVANEVLIDNQTKAMRLSGNVSILTDDGYKAATDSAEIDLFTKVIESKQKTIITHGNETTECQGFRIIDKGSYIELDGPVNIKITGR